MSPVPFITRKKEVRPSGGDWAAKLRAVGSVLDGQGTRFRELCILEVDHGFVVQGFEQAKNGAAWTSASLEIGTGDLNGNRPTRPTR
jgi:hypothetical protein